MCGKWSRTARRPCRAPHPHRPPGRSGTVPGSQPVQEAGGQFADMRQAGAVALQQKRQVLRVGARIVGAARQQLGPVAGELVLGFLPETVAATAQEM